MAGRGYRFSPDGKVLATAGIGGEARLRMWLLTIPLASCPGCPGRD